VISAQPSPSAPGGPGTPAQPSPSAPPLSPQATTAYPEWVTQGDPGSGPSWDAGAYTDSQNGQRSYNYSGWNAAQGEASKYDADKVDVTKDMLVEDRLANIMRSPVGRIAQQIASEQMNSRGMMDSTAAIQAITMAAIQAGLPIAEADAARFYDAAQTNMAAENERRRYNTEAENLMTQRNLNAKDKAASENASAMNRQNEFNITAFQEQYNNNREFAFNTFIEQSKLRQQQGETATTYMQDIWASGMEAAHAAKAFKMGYENGILSWKQAAEGVKNYAGHMVNVVA
jgi:hypothetical protein